MLYNLAMTTVTASVARQTLPAQLDRVEAGEQIAITRHGRVVAVLVSPEDLKQGRAAEVWRRAYELQARLEGLRGEEFQPAAISLERAEQLVEAIREGRSR